MESRGEYTFSDDKHQDEDSDNDSENEAEDDLSDIFSSDSDNSSLDELRAQLIAEQEKDDKRGKVKELSTAEQEELEKLFFFSIYLDELPSKKQAKIKPQTNEEFDMPDYTPEIIKGKDIDAERFVINEVDEEEFNEFLKSEINEDEGIEDIDGNISIRTLTERNFHQLRMDGPSRRIAILFSYNVEERPISLSFLKFMHLQKEKFPFISGVLLYYKGIGIHVVEGSEYILLMHFPLFFRDDCFKRLKQCKILALEELSAMKFFEQYSCYKAEPIEPKIKVPKQLESYEDSVAFMKKIGKGLDAFFRHAYSDFPSVTTDNELPECINRELPSMEALQFLLDGKWYPGLRPITSWYSHLTVVPGEVNDADFVWPPRSDGMPVHFMHPAPGEEEAIRNSMKQMLKLSKIQISSQFKPHREEGEAPPPPSKPPISDDEEYAGVKKIVSKSSLFDVERLDCDLEEHLEAEEESSE